MNDAIAAWSPFVAFLVSGSLFAWCLIRAARSTPSFLMALLLGSFATWNLFEWLWWFTGRKADAYLKLEFIGVTLAPCFAFHYALSLAGRSWFRPYALTAVYSGTTFFLGTALAGLASQSASDFFMAHSYNAAYLVFFVPVVAWTVWVLERSRRRATDPRVRSLFAIPLVAGLIMVFPGFLELAIPVFGWEGAPRLASLGALVGSVVIAVGIMKNRTVYDAFAVLRQDSANVLRATVQGVLYLDPDGRVVFSNSVARELLGVDPKTLAETGLEVPPSGVAVVRRGNRVLELRVAKSSDVFPPGRFSLILQDKTRDFEFMQALASTEALAALGQSAATLAHEIRNPLTAINSALDCIVHDAAGGGKPESKHLELVREEVQRLNELLERTLELSKPIKLQREPCDLNSLVRRIVELPGANGSNVTLRLAPDLPKINADPDLVAQLVVNLVKNGIEASRDVRITTLRDSRGALLRVTSAGARIPDELLPHLFEPFYTTKVKGTGLGLALAKKVALAHNAEISGRNTSEGVDFEVKFPL